MLKVRLGKIVEYANKHDLVMQRAVVEFFGGTPDVSQLTNIDTISGLFNEWSIFDFKIPSGITFIVDYYLKNPNSLPKEQIKELEEIIKTQRFEMFEIKSLKRGKWLKVHGLYSDKDYTIHENKGSLEAPKKGTFWGRIAKVHGKYILVGSNPIYSPIISARHFKKFLKEKSNQYSPKEVVELIIPEPSEG